MNRTAIQRTDGFAKKTKSRREKSGKKPGGQAGHPGRTLEMVAAPHHTVGHFPAVCPCCGEALADVAATDIERRQNEVARQRGFQLHGHSLALYADCTKTNCPHRPRGE